MSGACDRCGTATDDRSYYAEAEGPDADFECASLCAGCAADMLEALRRPTVAPPEGAR